MAGPPLVVIVDDDLSVRESLPELLRQCGFAATAFPSADALLASDVLGQAACLILDIAMPGVSGIALARELGRRGQAPPIVFISGDTDERERSRLLQEGAVACVFKPFGEGVLLAAVRVALGAAAAAVDRGILEED